MLGTEGPQGRRLARASPGEGSPEDAVAGSPRGQAPPAPPSPRGAWPRVALPELGKRGRARSCGQWNPASRPGAGGLLSRSSLAPTSSLWGSRCTCEAEHVQGWLARGRPARRGNGGATPGPLPLAQGNADTALTPPGPEAADCGFPNLRASHRGLRVSAGNTVFRFCKTQLKRQIHTPELF